MGMHEGVRLLSDVLAEVASLSADPFDVTELVHLASDRACEVLACDGAIVLLSVDGRSLAAAGASSGLDGIERMLDLDATPCHVAMHTGTVTQFSTDDDTAEFEAFAAMASTYGILGVLSLPLRHKETLIGTLCLIRSSPMQFLPDTIDDAQTLADVIAATIIREQVHQKALAVTAQLQHALEARVIVEQAKGMVAAELKMSIDDALDRIRQYARSQHLRLTAVAEDIVRRELPIDRLRS